MSPQNLICQFGIAFAFILNVSSAMAASSFQGDPDDILFATVREIEEKARNWTEPSQESEERYVKAFNLWLQDLPELKQAAARKILAEAHQHLSELRQAIRAKKAELAAISFNEGSSPQHLCRLGMELRSLQGSLRNRLSLVSKRMKDEAGIEMGPVERQTLWLPPPIPHPSQQ